MAGVKFHFTEYGAGQPIIILHGLLGSSKNWTQQAKLLAEHFRVICVDLPNHGQSYRTENMTYKEIAQNIVDWVKETFVEPVHVLGHSMGGKVTMKALEIEPSLFDKGIIVDIAPVQYPLHHTDIFDALNAVNLEKIKSRKDADIVLKEKVETPSLRNFLLHSLLFKNDKWFWEFDLSGLTKNQNNVADGPLLSKTINNETLFIKGELSDYIKEEYVSVINKHFTNVSYKQIANVGHWPHAEKAKVFNHMVFNFFSN